MRFLDRLLKPNSTDPIHVTDPKILDCFLKNPNFPWLISFPRTGSHWLRMIMELYFEKPSLRRVFFYPDAKDFTCYHWHDVDLATENIKSVIYLYRHPVDTIFSQLRYHKEDARDVERVRHWSVAYARHLSKWLFEESFSARKTIVRYEGLREDPYSEFSKICGHFDQQLDSGRLEQALSRVSKDDLKRKTADDQQVVNLSQEYEIERAAFRTDYGPVVIETLYRQDPRLSGLWETGK